MHRLLATLMFVLSATVPAWAADWTTFTDASGTLSLSVPQSPVYSSGSTRRADGGTATTAEYTIDKGNSTMMALIGDFTGMVIDPATARDRAVGGMQTEGRTLLSDQTVTIDGHAGRDVKLTDAAGDAITDRAFFFGDHLYQIITVTTKTATADQVSDAARYAASLHFLR
ncbi:MAG TPA: hypothetical protein VJ476_14255 [Rhizomicrobium sp.]|nr:hypothetical protein [Rhizomicrobium sp.]